LALAADYKLYENSDVTLTFANLLPNSHYRIVMYASSEDPYIYKLISDGFVALEINTPRSNALLLTFKIWVLLALMSAL
jgi:hypothetical protein